MKHAHQIMNSQLNHNILVNAFRLIAKQLHMLFFFFFAYSAKQSHQVKSNYKSKGPSLRYDSRLSNYTAQAVKII